MRLVCAFNASSLQHHQEMPQLLMVVRQNSKGACKYEAQFSLASIMAPWSSIEQLPCARRAFQRRGRILEIVLMQIIFL